MSVYPFIGVLPLILTMLLTLKVRSPGRAIAFGALSALALHFLELLAVSLQTSRKALLPVIISFGSETFHTVYEILIGKAGILLSVLVLLTLVHLICSSGLITFVENAVDRHAETPRGFTSLFITLCMVFAIDDYLDCVALPAAAGRTGIKQGIRKETLAYLTSILSIAFCVLIPFSSWAPFISGTVKDSLPELSTGTLQEIGIQSRIMNLAVLTLPAMAVILLFSEASSCPRHKIKRKQASGLPASKSLIPLMFAGIAMAMAMITVNFCTNGDFTVAAGGSAGLAVLFLCLLHDGKAGFGDLVLALKNGGSDTLSLARTLLSIWVLTSVCSGSLSLSRDISLYMGSLSGSACLIPGLIYLASGLFAFITGSSFGSIGLFVPLAIAMTKAASPVSLIPAGISAALAGAMQAGNSVASDTIQLTQTGLHGEEFRLRAMQRSMAVVQGTAYTIGYLLMGILSGQGPAAMTLVPAVCICLFYAFFFRMHKTSDDLRTWSGMRLTDPFPRQVFTFHMAVVLAEYFYIARLISLIAHSLNRLRTIPFRREILCLRSP